MTIPSQAPAMDQGPPDQTQPEAPEESGDAKGYEICIRRTEQGATVTQEPLDDESAEGEAGPAGAHAPATKMLNSEEDVLKAVHAIWISKPVSGGEEAGFVGGNAGERMAMGGA